MRKEVIAMARGIRFEPDTAERARDDPYDAVREAFQERVGRGRYDDLLADSLRAILREGAAIRGLDEELGAIRFALAKLLAEELDAGKLAAGVARLTSASVQAMKVEHALGDATDASLSDLLNEILADLDERDTS
jgi:hypothetical protein